METLGDKLRKDPRIAEAKKLLREAISEQQKKITGVKDADPKLKISYDQLLDQFAKIRGSKLFYPYIGSGLGKGCLVELADGSIKYDFINGIGPHFCGHSYPGLLNTSVEAAIEDVVIQGNLQQNYDSVALCKQLIEASHMDHCFLTSSGAMANENALKIAFQKKFPASRVLAFERCFMGRTLVMSQITDKPAYRVGLPQTIDVDYVPFFDHARPQESTAETLRAIERHIKRYPGQHAVMCMELVQGEAGFHAAPQEYFRKIAELLRSHGVLVMVDEVQTFGRTYELFAYHYFGLKGMVDICTIGKLSQVCATLFTENVNPKPGLLSQTFTASTAAIHASRYIINTLLKGGYFGPKGKIAHINQYFSKQLAKLEPKYIHGPFGIGVMIAFTPYDGSAEKATDFAKRLFDNGVISFTAGANPTRVRFLAPAIAVTDSDIDAVMNILEKTLKEGS